MRLARSEEEDDPLPVDEMEDLRDAAAAGGKPAERETVQGSEDCRKYATWSEETL